MADDGDVGAVQHTDSNGNRADVGAVEKSVVAPSITILRRKRVIEEVLFSRVQK